MSVATPAVRADRQECVDVCPCVCVYSVREETTEELLTWCCWGIFSAVPRPQADSQETGLRSLLKPLAERVSRLPQWVCGSVKTGKQNSETASLVCVFVSSCTWENIILTPYFLSYSSRLHRYFTESNLFRKNTSSIPKLLNKPTCSSSEKQHIVTRNYFVDESLS